MTIELHAIGHVRNLIEEKKDTGWGSDVSVIEMNPEYVDGLTGLSDFSHVIVVYCLHEANYVAERHLTRKPQGREDMPTVGIFAQRAKDRPNRIGVTAVGVVGVKGNRLTVKGLDAINGTPVIDLKPYFPVFDRKDQAVVPEWVDRLMGTYF